MEILIGKYLGTNVRRMEPRPGDSWSAFDVHELQVLEEGPNVRARVLDVQIGERDRVPVFGPEALPEKGELVALEVQVGARAKNDRAFMTYKAWGVLPAEYAEALASVARG